jgi:nitrogen regulatory protein P-II 2
MQTTPMVLLTIIAEPVLRERLVAEVQRLGSTGYTLTEVSGEGSRHRRVGDMLEGNFKLESVVTEAVAQRLLGLLAMEYFPRFALIAYTTPVEVVRGDKYV